MAVRISPGEFKKLREELLEVIDSKDELMMHLEDCGYKLQLLDMSQGTIELQVHSVLKTQNKYPRQLQGLLSVIRQRFRDADLPTLDAVLDRFGKDLPGTKRQGAGSTGSSSSDPEGDSKHKPGDPDRTTTSASNDNDSNCNEVTGTPGSSTGNAASADAEDSKHMPGNTDSATNDATSSTDDRSERKHDEAGQQGQIRPHGQRIRKLARYLLPLAEIFTLAVVVIAADFGFDRLARFSTAGTSGSIDPPTVSERAFDAAPGKVATIKIITAQEGVEIAVDGVTRGRAPAQVELEAGSHAIVLRHSGYPTQSHSLLVSQRELGSSYARRYDLSVPAPFP